MLLCIVYIPHIIMVSLLCLPSSGLLLNAMGHAAPNIATQVTALQAMAKDPVRALHALPRSKRCVHALHNVTMRSLSRQQFLDPVFAGVPTAEYSLTSDPLAQGFCCYIIIMTCLTIWDEIVLPKMQDRGIMPTMPGTLRATRLEKVSLEQRALPWLTPATAQFQGKGLPTLEEILRKPVRVGEYNGVTQFIKAHAEGERVPEHQAHRRRFGKGEAFDADELDSVCMISPEFSEHYGKRVFVCKRQTERGDFHDDLSDFAA